MEDKVYIESESKNAKTAILLPNYGEVKLIVQQGKVIRFETKEINLLDK
ncbi:MULTISPECIES: DUF2292 domain-containing protein [Enterococcus]|nr:MULTISPECIES: DUF2292 domain-containing protein [Enterococcus]MDK4449765.1 DUF2292 domain-containing protein [Enterococcus casseliflavus]MDY2549277.1 DUF2292 domain-containing protein [Enterococcus casseliflavus]NQE02707.1 DUF2292 domain-containing protein [Enterococcus gallinarum]